MLDATATATATARVDIDKIIDRDGAVGTGVRIHRSIGMCYSDIRNIRHARDARCAKENQEKARYHEEYGRYSAKYGARSRIRNMYGDHDSPIIHPAGVI